MGVTLFELVEGDPVIQDRFDTLILKYQLGAVLLGNDLMKNVSIVIMIMAKLIMIRLVLRTSARKVILLMG